METDFLEEIVDKSEEVYLEKIRKKIEFIKEKTKKSEDQIIKELSKLKKEFDTILTDFNTILEIYMGQLGILEENQIFSANKKIKDLAPDEYVNLEVEILSQRITPKVGILKIRDETGITRAITFDTSLIKGLNEGEIIKITDGYVREGRYGLEIVIGKRTKIEKIKEIKIERKSLEDIKEDEVFESLIIITKIFEPKEVEREIDNEKIKKIITPIQITDGKNYKTAYLNYKFEKENEGKTFLIRGKPFKGKDNILRINIISLIHPNLEEEILKETKPF